jgi:hypothetical protein
MVSGWDRNPPEPRYEPDFGPGGRILITALIAFFLMGAFGWILM